MRVLLVAGWHHFAFLVISLALLGFGAGGTALCLARTRWLSSPSGSLRRLALVTGVSMPVCTALVQSIGVEARIVPALLWQQIGAWCAYWLVLAIPFLAGGAAIGLSLMCGGPRVGRVYAANLAGSAAGCGLALALMHVIWPWWLPAVAGVPAVVVAAALSRRSARAGMETAVGIAVAIAVLVLAPPRINPDPDKYSAYLERLERQDSIERVARSFGPRSLIEVYEGDLFHDMPFLTVGLAPPPMLSVTVDGHHAGSVLQIEDIGSAGVVDQSLMFAGHALGPPQPSVLLLGEFSGNNVWLGLRNGATRIDVVHPDQRLLDLVREELAQKGGGVLRDRAVHLNGSELRHFVEHADRNWDIVQLVSLEGTSAGSGGIAGLTSDHLLTVEGIEACLRRLTPEGVLFACRGIQTPPRDNLKLIATFYAALKRSGADQPEQHMVVVRDYLAVCTLVKASPWTGEQVAQLRSLIREKQLTPSWFPGVSVAELNRPDALPGPEEVEGDWFHFAVSSMAAGDGQRFLEEWPFFISPATDDRPFYFDFCKLRTFGALREAFGDTWITRMELAFPIVLAAMLLMAFVGGLLTLLPVAIDARFRRRAPASPAANSGRVATVVYFAAIGLAYLVLEMTVLARLTLLIGDPVTAAAVTICAFLLASGLGSLAADSGLATRVLEPHEAGGGRRARWVFVAILLVGGGSLAAVQWLVLSAGGASTVVRVMAGAAVCVPVAILMGMPMPLALARLERSAPPAIPWAWGINGFASVLSAPLATVIGMIAGYQAAGWSALALYAIAGWAFVRLPGCRRAEE